MDKLDRHLLNIVQRNCSITAERLAEQVPLSPSAITRRLKRMREDGTIAAEVAILSQRTGEDRITAIINIQLDRHKPSEWDTLKKFLTDAPEVQICFQITGTADVLLIASTDNLAHFNEFADRIGSHPLVRRYETTFAKRHIKMSLAIALPLE